MSSDQAADKNTQAFCDAFLGALVGAMAVSSGSPWAIAAVPGEDSNPDGSEPVRMRCVLGGTLRGAFLLEFRRAEAVALAAKMLQRAADEFGAEESAALQKVVEAAKGKFHSALEPEYGTFTMEAAFASEPLAGRASAVQITAGDGGANRVTVAMHCDTELTQSLLLRLRAAGSAAGARTATKVVAGNVIMEPVNLDLVMDVELNVTLRFGQRQLTLREVMDLTSGSVVELDRQVEEPVELLLNGTVIARGEAVVIDGNYGLRVTEVTQPVSSLTLR